MTETLTEGSRGWRSLQSVRDSLLGAPAPSKGGNSAGSPALSEKDLQGPVIHTSSFESIVDIETLRLFHDNPTQYFFIGGKQTIPQFQITEGKPSTAGKDSKDAKGSTSTTVLDRPYLSWVPMDLSPLFFPSENAVSTSFGDLHSFHTFIQPPPNGREKLGTPKSASVTSPGAKVSRGGKKSKPSSPPPAAQRSSTPPPVTSSPVSAQGSIVVGNDAASAAPDIDQLEDWLGAPLYTAGNHIYPPVPSKRTPHSENNSSNTKYNKNTTTKNGLPHLMLTNAPAGTTSISSPNHSFSSAIVEATSGTSAQAMFQPPPPLASLDSPVYTIPPLSAPPLPSHFEFLHFHVKVVSSDELVFPTPPDPAELAAAAAASKDRRGSKAGTSAGVQKKPANPKSPDPATAAPVHAKPFWEPIVPPRLLSDAMIRILSPCRIVLHRADGLKHSVSYPPSLVSPHVAPTASTTLPALSPNLQYCGYNEAAMPAYILVRCSPHFFDAPDLPKLPHPDHAPLFQTDDEQRKFLESVAQDPPRLPASSTSVAAGAGGAGGAGGKRASTPNGGGAKSGAAGANANRPVSDAKKRSGAGKDAAPAAVGYVSPAANRKDLPRVLAYPPASEPLQAPQALWESVQQQIHEQENANGKGAKKKPGDKASTAAPTNIGASLSAASSIGTSTPLHSRLSLPLLDVPGGGDALVHGKPALGDLRGNAKFGVGANGASGIGGPDEYTMRLPPPHVVLPPPRVACTPNFSLPHHPTGPQSYHTCLLLGFASRPVLEELLATGSEAVMLELYDHNCFALEAMLQEPKSTPTFKSTRSQVGPSSATSLSAPPSAAVPRFPAPSSRNLLALDTSPATIGGGGASDGVSNAATSFLLGQRRMPIPSLSPSQSLSPESSQLSVSFPRSSRSGQPSPAQSPSRSVGNQSVTGFSASSATSAGGVPPTTATHPDHPVHTFPLPLTLYLLQGKKGASMSLGSGGVHRDGDASRTLISPSTAMPHASEVQVSSSSSSTIPYIWSHTLLYPPRMDVYEKLAIGLLPWCKDMQGQYLPLYASDAKIQPAPIPAPSPTPSAKTRSSNNASSSRPPPSSAQGSTRGQASANAAANNNAAPSSPLMEGEAPPIPTVFDVDVLVQAEIASRLLHTMPSLFPHAKTALSFNNFLLQSNWVRKQYEAALTYQRLLEHYPEVAYMSKSAIESVLLSGMQGSFLPSVPPSFSAVRALPPPSSLSPNATPSLHALENTNAGDLPSIASLVSERPSTPRSTTPKGTAKPGSAAPPTAPPTAANATKDAKSSAQSSKLARSASIVSASAVSISALSSAAQNAVVQSSSTVDPLAGSIAPPSFPSAPSSFVLSNERYRPWYLSRVRATDLVHWTAVNRLVRPYILPVMSDVPEAVRQLNACGEYFDAATALELETMYPLHLSDPVPADTLRALYKRIRTRERELREVEGGSGAAGATDSRRRKKRTDGIQFKLQKKYSITSSEGVMALEDAVERCFKSDAQESKPEMLGIEGALEGEDELVGLTTTSVVSADGSEIRAMPSLVNSEVEGASDIPTDTQGAIDFDSDSDTSSTDLDAILYKPSTNGTPTDANAEVAELLEYFQSVALPVTTHKTVKSLHPSLPKSTRYGSGWFNRIVLVLAYDDNHTINQLQTVIQYVNTLALAPTTSLRSYSMTSEEAALARNGNLDIITGLHIISPKEGLRILLLEGIAPSVRRKQWARYLQRLQEEVDHAAEVETLKAEKEALLVALQENEEQLTQQLLLAGALKKGAKGGPKGAAAGNKAAGKTAATGSKAGSVSAKNAAANAAAAASETEAPVILTPEELEQLQAGIEAMKERCIQYDSSIEALQKAREDMLRKQAMQRRASSELPEMAFPPNSASIPPLFSAMELIYQVLVGAEGGRDHMLRTGNSATLHATSNANSMHSNGNAPLSNTTNTYRTTNASGTVSGFASTKGKLGNTLSSTLNGMNRTQGSSSSLLKTSTSAAAPEEPGNPYIAPITPDLATLLSRYNYTPSSYSLPRIDSVLEKGTSPLRFLCNPNILFAQRMYQTSHPLLFETALHWSLGHILQLPLVHFLRENTKLQAAVTSTNTTSFSTTDSVHHPAQTPPGSAPTSTGPLSSPSAFSSHMPAATPATSARSPLTKPGTPGRNQSPPRTAAGRTSSAGKAAATAANTTNVEQSTAAAALSATTPATAAPATTAADTAALRSILQLEHASMRKSLNALRSLMTIPTSLAQAYSQGDQCWPTLEGIRSLATYFGGPVELKDSFGTDHPSAQTVKETKLRLSIAEGIRLLHTRSRINPEHFLLHMITNAVHNRDKTLTNTAHVSLAPHQTSSSASQISSNTPTTMNSTLSPSMALTTASNHSSATSPMGSTSTFNATNRANSNTTQNREIRESDTQLVYSTHPPDILRHTIHALSLSNVFDLKAPSSTRRASATKKVGGVHLLRQNSSLSLVLSAGADPNSDENQRVETAARRAPEDTLGPAAFSPLHTAAFAPGTETLTHRIGPDGTRHRVKTLPLHVTREHQNYHYLVLRKLMEQDRAQRNAFLENAKSLTVLHENLVLQAQQEQEIQARTQPIQRSLRNSMKTLVVPRSELDAVARDSDPPAFQDILRSSLGDKSKWRTSYGFITSGLASSNGSGRGSISPVLLEKTSIHTAEPWVEPSDAEAKVEALRARKAKAYQAERGAEYHTNVGDSPQFRSHPRYQGLFGYRDPHTGEDHTAEFEQSVHPSGKVLRERLEAARQAEETKQRENRIVDSDYFYVLSASPDKLSKTERMQSMLRDEPKKKALVDVVHGVHRSARNEDTDVDSAAQRTSILARINSTMSLSRSASAGTLNQGKTTKSTQKKNYFKKDIPPCKPAPSTIFLAEPFAGPKVDFSDVTRDRRTLDESVVVQGNIALQRSIRKSGVRTQQGNTNAVASTVPAFGEAIISPQRFQRISNRDMDTGIYVHITSGKKPFETVNTDPNPI